MSLQVPAVIRAAGVVGTPTSFSWGTSVSDEFLYPEDERLQKAYLPLDSHMAFGLIVALCEWLTWRAHGLVLAREHEDLRHRLEAAWVAANDPSRVAWTEFPWNDRARNQKALGVLMLATMFLEDGLKDFVSTLANPDDDVVFVWAVGATLAARHVTSRKRAAFAAWEKQLLPRLKKLYGGSYVSSRPIVREAYFDAKPPAPADLLSLRDRFLASVDPANPYLVGTKRSTIRQAVQRTSKLRQGPRRRRKSERQRRRKGERQRRRSHLH